MTGATPDSGEVVVTHRGASLSVRVSSSSIRSCSVAVPPWNELTEPPGDATESGITVGPGASELTD